MNTSVLLNVTGLSLSALGAVFFGIAFIMRNKTIEKTSTGVTWNGGLPEVKKWLLKSRKEGIVGLLLLFIGFVLQISAQLLQ